MAFRQSPQVSSEDAFKTAMIYYGILLALKGSHLPPKELELLAYTAVRGKINTHTAKVDFAERYNSTLSSINNMISRLTRKKYFVKNKSLITVNPLHLQDFKDGFVLNITCYGKPDSSGA